MIKHLDVRPGDWADHKSGVLKPRQVEAVDPKEGTVRFTISDEDMPITNYTFRRES